MPSIKELFIMSVRAVLPVSALIIFFQLFSVRVQPDIFIKFLGGMILAISGLVLFLAGVHLGLMPLGEHFGSLMAKTGNLWMLLLSTFVIGYAVTVAEPSVLVLAEHAYAASGGEITKNILVNTIGIGIAVFMAVAVFKIVRGVNLKFILMTGYVLIFIATFFSGERFIPISYDSGGVTTGSVTVPFVLAFGMGIALTLRGKDTPSDSFGMLGVASMGPILAMLLLSMLVK